MSNDPHDAWDPTRWDEPEQSANAYQCPRCVDRGKVWEGDQPVCGFDAEGRFLTDNWMCATLNALRDAVAGQRVYHDDYYAAIVRVPVVEDEDEEDEDVWIVRPGTFLALRWYKRRGRTDTAVLIRGGGKSWPLTLAAADALLEARR